jgi:hypothetical protein
MVSPLNADFGASDGNAPRRGSAGPAVLTEDSKYFVEHHSAITIQRSADPLRRGLPLDVNFPGGATNPAADR